MNSDNKLKVCFLCNLGSAEVDAVFTILFTTDVFVGALVGFILDNTIPGNYF